MRKYYIDNTRILCILLLFPFHTAMVFNNFGENFYVHSEESILATQFIVGVYPWWMSVLFALAGMSTVYALKNRTAGEYAKERFFKLFIPLLSALVFLIPVQTYIADIYFNDYKGNYFEHLSVFLSITDFNGYDGHFTPAHTWFMLYLFVISMVCLPLMIWYKKREIKIDGSKLTMVKIIPICIIILLCTLIPEIGGKSIGEFGACFLLGYFVLSQEEVQDRLEKNYIWLTVAWLGLIIIRCTMYQMGNSDGIVWDIEQRVLSWIGILAIIGAGKKHLSAQTVFTKYFAPAAFPIYFFHQTVMVIVAFFLVPFITVAGIQYISIVIISFVVTLLLYEICRRFVITRFLFGIKK